MKTRKILAVILSVAMLLSLLTQAVWADEEQSRPQEPQENYETVKDGFEEDADSGIAPMSLLPLEYYSYDVTIDRTEKMPYELVDQPDGTVYVYELLKDALVKYGFMSVEDEKYSGTIVYSFDDSSYEAVDWYGTITIGNRSLSRYVYFILGDGDQLNPDNIKLRVDVDVELYIGRDVTIDRTESYPEEFLNDPEGTVYLKDILNDVLLELGLITEENPVYSGKITRKIRELNPETLMYTTVEKEITQEDKVVANGTLELTLDDGLGTDTSYKRIRLNCEYVDIGTDLLEHSSIIISSSESKLLTISDRDVYIGNIYDENNQMGKSAHIASYTVSATEAEKGEAPKINFGFSIKYAKTQVYLGYFRDESGIDESKNITKKLLSAEAYQLTESEPNTDYSTTWYLDVTFTVKVDEKTFYIPSRITININCNYVRLSGDSQYYVAFSKEEMTQESYIGSCAVVNAPDFNNVVISLRGTYYNYVDKYDTGSYGKYVNSAYFGEYATEEEAIAAGAANIKEKLFSINGYIPDVRKGESQTAYAVVSSYYMYERPVFIEIQLKKLVFTVFDEYGLVHHPVYYIGIDMRDISVSLSNSTYFQILGANVRRDPADPESADILSTYLINENDSYTQNGYQTVFIMDGDSPIPDGTTIYPTFSANTRVKVFNGTDVKEETSTNHQQISGESPIIFKNGEAVQYSAASESGTHLKNYWVTYITPSQGGAKLFVNATNNPDHYDENLNPVREIFFNSKYGYYHDVLFANIGDADLEDISVELENEQGVKLDDYWTVNSNGIKKLAPFTSVNYPERDYNDDGKYVQYNGELSNIAKIRLNPVDDSFGPISGTLTISAKDQKAVVIKLTGIAGTPKIVTDKIYDGVKYVPYSSVIMTNSMYEDNAMQFSIVDGRLPNGIELLPNGELYGIPTEVGDFTFTVQAKYTGTIAENNGDEYADVMTYTMTVKDNTDENVDAVNNIDNQGYPLTDRVSKYITVYYKGISSNRIPVIDRVVIDSDLFRSEGSYNEEFVAFYIDGIKLTEGVDYYAAEGSTKITVLAETFEHIGISDSDTPHTLAAEFRTDEAKLMRSAQNVYIEYVKKTQSALQPGGSFSGGGSFTGGGSFSGGSSSGGSSSDTNAVAVEPSFNSVNINMSISDANGSAVPNLALELHSAVQYATSDASGAVKFDNVEFGRHTLYITDPVTNETSSKTFTLVSGFGTEITDDIIVAEVGKTISVAITFDGGNIVLASAQTDVDVPTESAATDEEPEEEAGTDAAPADTEPVEESNPKTGIVLGVVPVAALAGLIVSLKRK